MKVQEGIADRFEAMTGITVEVVPVSENLMGQRATAAFSAGRLPDIWDLSLRLTYDLGFLFDGERGARILLDFLHSGKISGAFLLPVQSDQYA